MDPRTSVCGDNGGQLEWKSSYVVTLNPFLIILFLSRNNILMKTPKF